jgi:hypothetical protein
MNVALKSYVVATVMFLLLAFLVPLYMYMELNVPVMSANIAIAWFIAAYAGLQLSLLSVNNRERVLELTFWIFTYVFMGIGSFVQLAGNRFPWDGSYGQAEIAKCLFILILGMVCYQTGLALGRRKAPPAPMPERPIRISGNGFMLIAAASVLLSVILIAKGNGFHALFLPRNNAENAHEVKSLGLILDQFSRVPLFTCLVLGIWMWKKHKFTRVSGPVTVIALLLLNAIISNPISSSRYWSGSVALTVVLLAAPWRKLGFARWSFIYLTVLLLVFPYADLFRNRLDASLQVHKVTDLLMDKGDYDAFQMMLNSSKYTDLNGIVYGRQFLSTFLFWVPRSVWPSKPYSSGQEIGEALGYSFTNLSCPLWAESYINFGYLGVAAVFLLYGYATSRLQQRYMSSKPASGVTFSQLMVPFLSAFQIFLLRGDLQNAVTYVSVYVLAACLISLNRRTRKMSLQGGSAAGSFSS